MKSQKTNNKIDLFVYPIFFIFAWIVVNIWGYTMLDDGWRHLSMAFNKDELKSWGELFIHSLYKDYDPWFMWHKLINLLGQIFGNENAHLVINSFVYFALSSWYYLILTKFSNIDKKLIFLLSLFLPIFNIRYFYLRPDILSGLFLLYFMLIKRKSLMILVTLLYMPFYYVFWFYLGFIGLVKIYLKKYKDLFILMGLTLIGFAFHLYYDFDGFIDITKNVLNNDKLLQGFSVGESEPFVIPIQIKNFLGSTVLLLILMAFSFLVHYVLKPKDRVIELLIFLMPLIMLQARFYQLLSPLIYTTIVILLHKFYINTLENGIKSTLTITIDWIQEKSYFGNFTKKGFKIFSFSILIIFLAYSFIDKMKFYNELDRSIVAQSFISDEEYQNKRILLTSMDISLYLNTLLNPSAKYIPSCSLGWVDYDEEKKNTYFKIIGKESDIEAKEFFEFAIFNEIDIIIIKNNSNNIEFTNEDLKTYSYKFYKLYKNYIILMKN